MRDPRDYRVRKYGIETASAGSTGLSVIAAWRQLLRLGERAVRLKPRQTCFLTVARQRRVSPLPGDLTGLTITSDGRVGPIAALSPADLLPNHAAAIIFLRSVASEISSNPRAGSQSTRFGISSSNSPAWSSRANQGI